MILDSANKLTNTDKKRIITRPTVCR